MFNNDPELREMLRKLNENERQRQKTYRSFAIWIIACIIGIILLFVYVITTK